MLAKYEKICGGLLALIAFEQFDKMILTIATYGAEIWGFQQYKQVEDVHFRYCKIVLGSPDCSKYGSFRRMWNISNLYHLLCKMY